MSFACTSPCINVISYSFVYLNEVVFNAILTLKEGLGTMVDSPKEIRQATLFFCLDVQRISCVEIERLSAAIFVGLHSNEYLPKANKKDFAVSYWDVFVFGFVMRPCQESNFSLQIFFPLSSYSALVTHILFRNTSVLDRAAPPSNACVIGLKEQKKN